MNCPKCNTPAEVVDIYSTYDDTFDPSTDNHKQTVTDRTTVYVCPNCGLEFEISEDDIPEDFDLN